MKQDEVYYWLRDAIYSGQIKPGQRLVERQLAKEFHTSRVPLRESLLRLMTEGLVRRMPRQTSFVGDLSANDVQEIWLMRLTLEPVAACLAAARPQPEFVQKLYELADRMADALDRDSQQESAEFDLQFHRTVVESTGLPRLIRAYDLSHVPMLMSRLVGSRREPEFLRRQHYDYVGMIEQGDIAGAERLAREHVEGIARRLIDARESASPESETDWVRTTDPPGDPAG